MAKVKWAVTRLTFLPCLGEAITFGIVGHYLFNFPFEWSFMTGFVLLDLKSNLNTARRCYN